MDIWQLFEMLPTDSEPRLSNREWWLTSAAFQHLWIGIYALPVAVPIPEWQADELNVLADVVRGGVARFRALTYPAD